MSSNHDHSHRHHAHGTEALHVVQNIEHIHGPGCGHINVHEGSLCARGLCGHIEHLALAQRNGFKQMLEPQFFEDEDEEDEEEPGKFSPKQLKLRRA